MKQVASRDLWIGFDFKRLRHKRTLERGQPMLRRPWTVRTGFGNLLLMDPEMAIELILSRESFSAATKGTRKFALLREVDFLVLRQV